ncbi:TolC family protein [Flammeovirga sp. EKP202]|uniref:TolC family protein n=1 Tax=Flammeovirga sp. EKP202 TaxID=2770592 RepID=UPI00165F6955|nr:TolC family protein [Flammeovirga sp. EKP202]MBD0403164.1 TolC family protein [Flammeovirga sp. EKP202]
MKKFIYIYLLLIIPLSVKANDSLTLKECIQYAIENNLSIYQESLKVNQASLGVKQAKWQYAPSIGGSINGTFNAGRSIDPRTNAYIDHQFFNNTSDLSLNWTLFQGFKKKYQLKFEEYQLQASQYQMQNTKEQLVFEVIQAFYDVEYNHELLEITKAQIELSEKIVDRAISQQELGLKASADVAEMKAQLEKERLLSLQAQNKMMEAKARLVNIMNYNAPLNALSLQFEQPSIFTNDFGTEESIYTTFFNHSALLKTHFLTLQSSHQNLKSEKASYLPELGLYASINTGYFETNIDESGKVIPFRNQWQNNMNQTVGVRLYIPIFHQNTQRLAVQRAKIQVAESDALLKQQQQELRRTVGNDYREWKAFQKEIEQGKKVIEANDMAYEIALQKYEEGLIDIVTLLTVKQKLGQAEVDLLLSELNYLLKEKLLMFYQGNQFWI